jgi:putative addiction module killer protein
MIQIRKFRDSQGRIPFDDWLLNLKDSRARNRIKVRVDRLSIGLEGDWKSVGEDIRELRIPEGKGYRVYYAWDGETVVILLCGGNKSTQHRDIESAKCYWREYHGQS